MHKIKLILLFFVVSLGVMGQDLGVIDADTAKLPPRNGLFRLSLKTDKLYFRGFTGTKKEVISTNNTYSNPQWLTAIDATRLGTGTVNNTKLGYLSGVTSDVQGQLNSISSNATHSNRSILDATTASYTTAEQTKLAALPTNTTLQNNLDSKVDKVAGKQLSTNDFDNTYKSNSDANTIARHTHSNKSLLDTYTQTEVNLASAVSNTHTHINKTTLDNITAAYTTAEQTKLAGIATGATANSTDAQLRDRSTHTGLQGISTVSGLQDSLSNSLKRNASSITFPSQSVSPATPANGFSLFANSSNALSWRGTNGFTRTLDGTANTANRSYTLPNSSGTLSLLESNQTWTGTNTFGNSINVRGIYTNSSGISSSSTITTTYNQSGTGGYRSLWISPYEQATGSGSKLLIDAGTNTAADGAGTHTSRFSVDNAGNTFVNGALGIGTSSVSAGVKVEIIHNSTSDQVVLAQNANANGFSGFVAKDNAGTKFLTMGVNNTVGMPGSFGGAGEGVIRTSTLSNGLRLISSNPITSIGFTIGSTEVSKISSGGNFLLGTGTDSGFKLDVNGTARFSNTVTATSYRVSSLNTAPASATDTGTTGEIRITATHIYICTATNTWVRAALSTW